MTFVGVPLDHYWFRVRQAERAAAAAPMAKLDEDAAAAAEDLQPRGMEAGGVDDAQAQRPLLQAQPTRPTPEISLGSWRTFRIFLRCFGVTVSMLLVAWTLMTTSHGDLDPYQKAALVILCLPIAAMALVFTPKELDNT